MPTYADLGREIWWGLEYQPPTLARLCADLRAFYQVDAVHIGSKGDNNHLRGYHRSRAWIQNSRYCTNHTYSVSETPGNRGGGDPNWLAAIDFQPKTTAELMAACQRLDAAVRAGRLEKITEWYGNVDGDTRVDGYNNIANRAASSDSSHLWHLHMSFDRGRVGEDHSDLYGVLTGTAAPGGTIMFTKLGDRGDVVTALQALLFHCGFLPADHIDGKYGNEVKTALWHALDDSPTSDGSNYGPFEYAALQTVLAKKVGGGQPGPKGDKGDPGIGLVPGDVLTVTTAQRG